MTEEENQEKSKKQMALEQLKDKEGADEPTREEVRQQIATRKQIERDFQENTVPITFETAPNVNRTVNARKPTHKELMKLMNLSVQAGKYEGQGDPESLERMMDVWEELGEFAAKLSVDDNLTQDFWEEKVSGDTLQNFITELIMITQKGSGMPEERLQSFRGE